MVRRRTIEIVPRFSCYLLIMVLVVVVEMVIWAIMEMTVSVTA